MGGGGLETEGAMKKRKIFFPSHEKSVERSDSFHEQDVERADFVEVVILKLPCLPPVLLLKRSAAVSCFPNSLPHSMARTEAYMRLDKHPARRSRGILDPCGLKSGSGLCNRVKGGRVGPWEVSHLQARERQNTRENSTIHIPGA